MLIRNIMNFRIHVKFLDIDSVEIYDKSYHKSYYNLVIATDIMYEDDL